MKEGTKGAGLQVTGAEILFSQFEYLIHISKHELNNRIKIKKECVLPLTYNVAGPDTAVPFSLSATHS